MSVGGTNAADLLFFWHGSGDKSLGLQGCVTGSVKRSRPVTLVEIYDRNNTKIIIIDPLSYYVFQPLLQKLHGILWCDRDPLRDHVSVISYIYSYVKTMGSCFFP